MRTNTFETHHTISPFRRSPIARSFRLVAHSLKSILDNRLNYLKHRIPIEARAKAWPVADWPAHIDQFRAFVGKAEDDGIDRFEFLLSIFGHNRRAQMQIIQLMYFDYLGMHGGSQYRLIERMMKAGFRFPPRHYKYEKSGREILTKRADDVGLDNRFLPSLFAFPSVAGDLASSFNHSDCDLLLGIRLLQIVKAHERSRVNTADVQPLAVFEICHVLQKLFGYGEDLVKRVIVEYSEFEIWKLSGEIHWTDGELNDLRIEPQAKLEFLLERCIFDIAYLSLAIMRAPIDAGVGIGREKAQYAPFIRLASFDRSDGVETLERWIEAKFLNSVSTYRLLRELNESQRKQIVETARSVSNKKRYLQIRDNFIYSNPFDFVQKMRRELAQEMEKNLLSPIGEGSGYRPFDAPTMREAIQRYSDTWCAETKLRVH